ncbi:SUKH-3 domain-containing protein [Streptomyces sp. NBC_00199]|uniref:SUKH-3 domain-containing protein n=1 Tax=Streptomyces sp. NBC_00199 TaxID=2975678 RepID=UPI0022538B18|nr:SUKH-3 domain-containing protein [Streptomyces sp. NBC_00199]MCX5269583.1 SUKH-3 domain-containing protein [Streptomyces sp. NBC_00199]
MSDQGLAAYLRSLGWDEADRSADAAATTERMRHVGFVSNETAEGFSGRYLGLRIEHPPALSISGRNITSWTLLDPTAVCTARDANVAERCAAVAGTPGFPVGVDSFHLTLYAGEDGAFYAGFDSSVFRYGRDAEEFFHISEKASGPACEAIGPFREGYGIPATRHVNPPWSF